MGSYLEDKSKKDMEIYWKITYQLKELSVNLNKRILELGNNNSGNSGAESLDLDDDLDDNEKSIKKAGDTTIKVSIPFKIFYKFISIHTNY